MMTKSGNGTHQPKNGIPGSAPSLEISRIGIISRDYRCKYDNGYRDFSHVMPKVLSFLDKERCDAILFSLFGVIPRDSFRVLDVLKRLGLKSIKAVFLEEFQDGETRKAGRFVVYHAIKEGWNEYDFCQKFGTITGMPQGDIEDFVKIEMPRRFLGNCCVLLCGETNGVKYSPKDKKIKDTFNLRASIPQEARIVLNPVHDRMTRFEMRLKRKFLSEGGRWVVSVWNKGRQDRNSKVRNGDSPAWTIFHNGEEIELKGTQNKFGVEIGILDVTKP